MISEKGLELFAALEEALKSDDAWNSEGEYFESKDEILDYIASLESENARLKSQLHEMREGIDPLDSNPGRDVPALALAVSLIEGQDGFIYPHEYFAVVALTVDSEL